MIKNTHHIDLQLQEFAQDTASSGIKLEAAWDNLSTESQIKILSSVDKNNKFIFGLTHKMMTRCLDNSSEYIRYLAARRANKIHNEKILADKSPLVRTSVVESFANALVVKEKNEQGNDASALKPEKFFSLPIEEQILYFSNLSVQHGKIISQILVWGLANNALYKDLLVIFLDECADNFTKTHAYGNSLSSSADGMEALWKLVIKLGEENKYLDIDYLDYEYLRLPSALLPSHIKGNEILNEIIISAFIEILPIMICSKIAICNKKLSEEIINQLDNRILGKLVRIRYPSLYCDITDGKIKHGEETEQKLEQKLHQSQPELSFEFKPPEITKKNLKNTYWASFGIFILLSIIVDIFNLNKGVGFLIVYGIPILISGSITIDYIKQNITKKFDRLIDKVSNKIKSEIKLDRATTENN